MPAELQSTSHLKVVDVHEMSWIRLPAFASEEAKQRLSQICGHHSHGASLKCNLLINEKQVVVAS
jgi:hypothetical protein